MKLMMKYTLFFLFLVTSTVQAAVIIDGTESDITPSDSSTWTSTVDVCVGNTSNGILTVNGDGGSTVVNSQSCLIGVGSETDSSVEGTLTVNSSDAEWNVASGDLIAGVYGIGELNVSTGGTINNAGFSVAGRFAGSVGTINISDSGSAVTSTKHIYVGHEGTGYLNITNGGSLTGSAGASIGSQVGSNGAAIVSGSGSTWTMTSDLLVGEYGTGELTISDYGQVTCQTTALLGLYQDASGIVNISGSGASLALTSDLVAGYEGSGEINVSGGATVTNGGYGNIGRMVSATGTVNVSDSGSTWTSSNTLNVGSEGTGYLNITNGGAVSCPYAIIGNATGANGTATISGTDSAWTVTGDIRVANAGEAELNITSGATMDVGGYVILADDPGSSAVVNVSGSGSEWNITDTTQVGRYSTAELNITSGGKVNSGYRGIIGGYAEGIGTVTVSGDGSDWSVGERLYLGSSGYGELNVANNATASVVEETYVGATGEGVLNITSGGTFTNSVVYIGQNAGSSGTATISDDTSEWIITSDMRLGNNGDGELNITNKATASVAANTFIGSSGKGVLNITSGGVLTSKVAYIGEVAGSNGIATISDDTSEWTITGDMQLGSNGDGELNITNGATVTVGSNATISRYAGSSGTLNLSGDGSVFIVTGGLNVGYTNSGTMSVLDGASVNCGGNLSVGASTGAEGSIVVSGSGSTFNVENGKVANIGLNGTGTLTVRDGAVANLNGCLAGRQSGSIGSVNVLSGATINSGGAVLGRDAVDASGFIMVSGNGSTWNMSSEAQIGRYGVGEITIEAGGKVNCSARCFVGNVAGSSGLATVSGKDSEWIFGDELLLGNNSEGEFNILNGGLVQVAKLTIGSNGLLNMSTGGMLAIPGDWSYSLDVFFGGVGTNYQNMQWWNNTLGDWESMYGNIPVAEYTLDYCTEGGYTLLTVGTVPDTWDIPGDANKDGKVDGSDVTILAGSWQYGVGGAGGATWEMGDFNGDGAVDGSDVTILAGNWQYGVTTAAASVPEPSTLLLLFAMLTSLVTMRCRRK